MGCLVPFGSGVCLAPKRRFSKSLLSIHHRSIDGRGLRSRLRLYLSINFLANHMKEVFTPDFPSLGPVKRSFLVASGDPAYDLSDGRE